jgi:hypothetical protein
VWPESALLNKYGVLPIDGGYKISGIVLNLSKTVDKLLDVSSTIAKEANSDIVVVWGFDQYYLKTGLHMNFYKK